MAIGVGWATGPVPPWSGMMDKPLLLPVSSLIAGVRQNLDIPKAWRGSSLGLCWVGFLADILCFLEQTQVGEAVPSLLLPHRRWHGFHTNMMEKRIISPPVQLQSLITWITARVCCHTGLGSCDAAQSNKKRVQKTKANICCGL